MAKLCPAGKAAAKKKFDVSRYSLIIILEESLGLYKNSNISDFTIT